MKFLLWLLLILVVLHLLRKKKNAAAAAWRAASAEAAATADPQYIDRSASPSTQSAAIGETMVACVFCGVYVPRSESISDAHQIVYCSESHRRLHMHS